MVKRKKLAGVLTAAVMTVGMGGLAACADEDGDGAVVDEEVDAVDEGLEDAGEEMEEGVDEVQDEMDESVEEVEE